MIPLISRIFKKSEQKAESDKYREQTDGCQREGGWGVSRMGEREWEIQASSYGISHVRIQGTT